MNFADVLNKSSYPKFTTKARRVGVIDIGSNSVRLVIYDVVGRSMQARFNEKVLAGLGRGLTESGVLNPEGLEAAMSALARFKAAMQAQGVDEELPFATAAVRDATNGAEFCARVREEIGLNIKVMTGADEARLAATGVIAQQPIAHGVSGDLGGSSLELSIINDGYYTTGTTYPLGPLALLPPEWLKQAESSTPGPSSFVTLSKKLRKKIDAELESSAELNNSMDTLYMVGGAWRAIARMHMEINEYPLRILQAYHIDAQELLTLTEQLQAPDKKMLALMHIVSSKRAQTLPSAAAVLNGVLRAGDFKTVVTSSYGVREGLVFEKMDEGTQRKDPLITGMQAMIADTPSNWEFGATLAQWLKQAAKFTLPERLAEAACLAADVGSRMHPDYRAEMAFEFLVTAPLTGWTHQDRAAVALAVASRYQRSFEHSISARLLSGEVAGQARGLGALMRLGAHFSARSADLLKYSRLEIRGGSVNFDVDEKMRALVSEMIRKRLVQAAVILGMEPRLSFSGEQAEL
ncbi:Ppx/GppA family phosphatase [Hirschia litorea]|uniref:Ppx/GppA family phosphatase n=1 Tax=Hirschia litorea TaxID=1199156 RepID=A0ABW2IIA3_9PROT